MGDFGGHKIIVVNEVKRILGEILGILNVLCDRVNIKM